MNEGERLKYLRKTLKMTQKDFGEKIGLKANTVSDIENGKYNLKEASIRLTCSEFKVDYIWLTTGEGEMFSNDKIKFSFKSLTKGDDYVDLRFFVTCDVCFVNIFQKNSSYRILLGLICQKYIFLFRCSLIKKIKAILFYLSA